MQKNKYQKFNKHYVKKNKKIIIKDYFKETFRVIKKRYGYKDNFSLVDAGCASGFFIEFISQKFKNAKVSGIDFSSQLISLAKKEYPFVKFHVRNLLKKNFKQIGKKNDITTCLGTLHAFDDLKVPLKNLFKITKKGGIIIIFTLVNRYDVSVISRYQKNYGQDRNWYTAFNNFSKPHWAECIKKIHPNSKIKFYKFKLKKKLKKTKKDPMRSWTTNFDNNKNQLTVGTSQVLNYNIIEIKK